MDFSAYERLASLLRYYILGMTWQAESGHPTSSFSSVDLATMLFYKYLRFDLEAPSRLDNDRVIFSKGHASALYYSLFAVAGKLSEEDLMKYRTFDSVLEGHPTARFPFTEAATGSLGQGLSIGAGEAWAIRRRNGGNNTTLMPRVYVLLGDGELAEGSNWEAAGWASHQKLNNLVAVVDVNRFGQSDETMLGHDVKTYDRRFTSFGWTTLVIDGHNFKEIDAAFQKAQDHRDGPIVIIAKTIKGKGIPFWEDKNGWHNKMLPKEEYEKARVLFAPHGQKPVGEIKKPEEVVSAEAIQKKNKKISPSSYKKEELVATKKAFGNALERLGQDNPGLYVLDGDVSNSLHTDQFKESFPEQFLQMYIAEQNMVGVATGLARQGLKPMIATFACFLTRAYDQLRLLPLSGVTMMVNGSYVGVSLGKDGPSQMGLEDIAMFRSIQGSTVLYPSDPYQTEQLVERMLSQKGVVYIRTTREPTPVVYASNDIFSIGGSYVFEPENREKGNPLVTIVAAGITLHEGLAARKTLAKEHISVRVIDCYSIKPIDAIAIKKAASDSMLLVIAEDHYPEGGLGEAVKTVLASNPTVPLVHLAVYKQPRSGTAKELLDMEGINATDIAETIRSYIQSKSKK